MAGYNGYSKSNNAVRAEQNGLLPLSRINGAPRWAIKLAAEFVGREEWHHTSKMYNSTDYYNAEKIVAVALSLTNQYAGKTASEQIEAKRRARWTRQCNSSGRIVSAKVRLTLRRRLAWDAAAREVKFEQDCAELESYRRARK